MRYIARAIEERGTAAVIVLTKWDAVPNKVSWPSKMDVSKNRGGPPKWMVYNGKPY